MDPQLLLLDEITSALDPELVAEVLDIVRELAERGHDDAAGHPRDGLRPRGRQQGLLPRPGGHPRAGPARADLSEPSDPRTRPSSSASSRPAASEPRHNTSETDRSPGRHLPVFGGAAGSCTVTQSPPAARGVRVRVPSCAWVMLLTIARPRPTPAWSVRMRLVPRRNGSPSVETNCGVSLSPVFSTVSTTVFGAREGRLGAVHQVAARVRVLADALEQHLQVAVAVLSHAGLLLGERPERAEVEFEVGLVEAELLAQLLQAPPRAS